MFSRKLKFKLVSEMKQHFPIMVENIIIIVGFKTDVFKLFKF